MSEKGVMQKVNVTLEDSREENGRTTTSRGGLERISSKYISLAEQYDTIDTIQETSGARPVLVYGISPSQVFFRQPSK
jgi:hypothetical protein